MSCVLIGRVFFIFRFLVVGSTSDPVVSDSDVVGVLGGWSGPPLVRVVLLVLVRSLFSRPQGRGIQSFHFMLFKVSADLNGLSIVDTHVPSLSVLSFYSRFPYPHCMKSFTFV